MLQSLSQQASILLQAITTLKTLKKTHKHTHSLDGRRSKCITICPIYTKTKETIEGPVRHYWPRRCLLNILRYNNTTESKITRAPWGYGRSHNLHQCCPIPLAFYKAIPSTLIPTQIHDEVGHLDKYQCARVPFLVLDIL